MKSHRKSRNTEGRNARKAMIARGRASISASALFDPDVVLNGRAFRRANGLSHAEAALANALLRPNSGALAAASLSGSPSPTITIIRGK